MQVHDCMREFEELNQLVVDMTKRQRSKKQKKETPVGKGLVEKESKRCREATLQLMVNSTKSEKSKKCRSDLTFINMVPKNLQAQRGSKLTQLILTADGTLKGDAQRDRTPEWLTKQMRDNLL